MRDFIKEWWGAIVVSVVVIAVMALVMAASNASIRQVATCQRSGYADVVRLNADDYCYRLDGNRLEGVLLEALGK